MPSPPHPAFALIADGFTDEERADRAVAAVRAGVRWVHLRDHPASPTDFAGAASALASRLWAVADETVVTVNSHLPVAVEMEVGLHVGRRGPSVAEARAALGRDRLLGYSAHEDVEGTGERTQEADYYFFSPVFPTSSKPDQPPAGIEGLRSFCRAAAGTPVVALGGITPGRVSACIEAGAKGVAVLSGIMDAEAPEAAARAYLRALALVA